MYLSGLAVNRHLIVWPLNSLHATLIILIEKDLDSVDAVAHEILPMRIDENQVAVTDLLAKSWFSRVWTYQENNCAAEATISSESLSIRSGYLRQFCLLFAFVQHEQWLKSKEAQHNLRQIANLSLMRDHLSQQSAASSLLKLVKRTKLRLATDSRDKIYGLVALASDTNPLPFVPSYEIAVNHLYEEFAAHVIRQNESLDIFQSCIFQLIVRECPSWVPDWRSSSQLTFNMNPDKKGFHAAGASCWDTSTIIVNHILGAEAICLDHFQNIASHRHPPGQ